ncbi:MAG: SsrA-binding protein SmpB [Candidatus Saccharimonadales bacterium]
MVRKNTPLAKAIHNKRANFDYELKDSYIVGIILSGRETKALRMGHGHLKGAYVTVKDGELWLVNASIMSTNNIKIEEHEQSRSRKLLAKRKQIDDIVQAKQQGETVVPLDLLIGGRFIKLRIAIGRGKKKYDKRQSLKARDESRAMSAALKQVR